MLEKYIILFFVLIGIKSEAQDIIQERVLHTDTCDLILFYKEISIEKQKDIDCDTCWYYSFSLDNVTTLQGGKGRRVLHGSYKEQYKSGKLKVSGQFKNGLKEGEWRRWDVNGNIISIENYRNGLFQGVQRYYTQNGVSEIRYVKGKKKDVQPAKVMKFKLKRNKEKAEKTKEEPLQKNEAE